MDHISETQVRAWLDDGVIQEIEATGGDTVAFNLQLRLSGLPLHVIKEREMGPLRIVGRTAFDTERTAAIVADADRRPEFLARIGPALAATPGFYTFLDEDGTSCAFPEVHWTQFEHRLYPDGASQQALMAGLMGIATAMQYIQNVAATMNAAGSDDDARAGTTRIDDTPDDVQADDTRAGDASTDDT